MSEGQTQRKKKNRNMAKNNLWQKTHYSKATPTPNQCFALAERQ